MKRVEHSVSLVKQENSQRRLGVLSALFVQMESLPHQDFHHAWNAHPDVLEMNPCHPKPARTVLALVVLDVTVWVDQRRYCVMAHVPPDRTRKLNRHHSTVMHVHRVISTMKLDQQDAIANARRAFIV